MQIWCMFIGSITRLTVENSSSSNLDNKISHCSENEFYLHILIWCPQQYEHRHCLVKQRPIQELLTQMPFATFKFGVWLSSGNIKYLVIPRGGFHCGSLLCVQSVQSSQRGSCCTQTNLHNCDSISATRATNFALIINCKWLLLGIISSD